ncbi:M55 family metallopeptidase, partial [Nonomuraea sp. RK-328]|nr:M55 family metallopeptidase [Nonomuraea sp. RK-328]
VLISVDMEGIAGIVHLAQIIPDRYDYERGRALMTAAANAAVAGVLEAEPAAEVLVADAHGPFRNILPEDLDRRARLIRGKPRELGMLAGLQVVENWNSANDKIYGREGVLTGTDREHAEVSMLTLHLLQSSLVFINTQLLQAVLRDPPWAGKLTEEDRRALSPLFWAHVNPYGRFRLDMETRLDLTAA